MGVPLLCAGWTWGSAPHWSRDLCFVFLCFGALGHAVIRVGLDCSMSILVPAKAMENLGSCHRFTSCWAWLFNHLQFLEMLMGLTRITLIRNPEPSPSGLIPDAHCCRLTQTVISGGPKCPHSLAFQRKYLHGCPSAALCTSALGVHGRAECEAQDVPCWPGDTQPSTQTHQLLCPPSQQVLGSAPTENHGTGVDTPGNIFRKEDRAAYTFPLPLLPPGRLPQSCLHPTSSSPLHPLTSLWLWSQSWSTQGRWAPGKPCPEHYR